MHHGMRKLSEFNFMCYAARMIKANKHLAIFPGSKSGNKIEKRS